MRAEFRSHIEDGLDAEAASARVIAEFGEAAADPEDMVTFWVGLAVTQSTLGRLQAAVRDRAVRLIDDGGDVARWELDNPKLAPRRAAALAKAREQLLGDQPEPRRLRPPKVHPTAARPGQVLAYTSASGAVVLLRVARIEVNRWSTGPVLQALDYDGGSVPGPSQLRRLRDRLGSPRWIPRETFEEPPWRNCVFYVMRVRASDPDFADAGFRVVGEVPLRSADEQLRARVSCGWDSLPLTLDRYTRQAADQ